MTATKAMQLEPSWDRSLEPLKVRFREKVIGDAGELVSLLAPSLYLARNNRWPERRPIEVVHLGGPTGTGKTYSVRTLFRMLGGNPDNLLRIDGAMLQSAHEVSRLIGAPAGYVGHRDTEPMLSAKAVKASVTRNLANPFILFDEFDKIHYAGKQALVGALDDGLIQLSDGTKVSMEGAFVFFTSNSGAMEAGRRTMRLEGGLAGAGEQIKATRNSVSPELRNRITKWLWLAPLTLNQTCDIVYLEFREAVTQFQIACRASLTAKAAKVIAERGFGPESGGRGVRRIIQNEIIPSLVSLEGGEPEQTITVGWNGKAFTFSR